MKEIIKYLVLSLSFVFILASAFGQDTLNAVRFDMESCIRLNLRGEKSITNREELNASMRTDASEERCQEMLEDFDFSLFSLFGINLNTGYCGEPLGLKITTLKIDSEMKIVFVIEYDEVIVGCRALSSYDLWMKIPSLPEGYSLEYREIPVKRVD